jgi:hypothetical protein
VALSPFFNLFWFFLLFGPFCLIWPTNLVLLQVLCNRLLQSVFLSKNRSPNQNRWDPIEGQLVPKPTLSFLSDAYIGTYIMSFLHSLSKVLIGCGAFLIQLLFCKQTIVTICMLSALH